MQIKKPQDFVIATGNTYSVKEFINKCTKILDLKTKWVGKGLKEKLIDIKKNKPIIIIDKKYFRPTEVNILKGDYNFVEPYSSHNYLKLLLGNYFFV